MGSFGVAAITYTVLSSYLRRFWHTPRAYMSIATVAGESQPPCPPSDDAPEARVDQIEEVASTRWLKLRTLHYTDRKGQKRRWDMVTRTTKASPKAADAVVIIPKLLKRGSEINTLLVKQFRPSFNCRTVEFPAGLIDAGETPQQAALRELYEETGYRGVAGAVLPMTALSPGVCDESVRMVLVAVDLDAPENADPKAQQDEGEDIEVEVVKLSELVDRLQQLDHEGYMVFTGVYTFAVGMEVHHPGWW
jgi:8-oxo-dGTP pyrophosphatase MutT (NUDIX family)